MLRNLTKAWEKTHHCGELTATQDKQEVTLMGWVSKCRDHGQLIFIDLRDQMGITQTVIDQTEYPEIHKQASELRHEYVIGIKGLVNKRPSNTINRDLPTGEIEILIKELYYF